MRPLGPEMLLKHLRLPQPGWLRTYTNNNYSHKKRYYSKRLGDFSQFLSYSNIKMVSSSLKTRISPCECKIWKPISVSSVLLQNLQSTLVCLSHNNNLRAIWLHLIVSQHVLSGSKYSELWPWSRKRASVLTKRQSCSAKPLRLICALWKEMHGGQTPVVCTWDNMLSMWHSFLPLDSGTLRWKWWLAGCNFLQSCPCVKWNTMAI